MVDTGVIASFWIKTARTGAAIRARRRDADWIAPMLWRSKFRSSLRQYLLYDLLGFADALWIAEKAESMMAGAEYAIRSADVLKLVEQTGHSSYDCEFVAVAEAEGLQLVTGDRAVARIFPQTAVLLEDFAR